MTLTSATALLTEDMLARFDERAPKYDRENTFFTDDFEELRASGYLSANLPVEKGGSGLNLAEMCRLQQELAYVAPATAVAVNMHIYWVGTAVDMARLGDPSGQWIIDEAATGKIFAAGHGEIGNDLPLLLSTTKAERVTGGWEITGHKIFGSLSPVWDYLGFHAMDTSDPEHPKIVHGFVNRDATRYHIEDTWDTLGMRATASQDTIFDKTFVPDEQVVLVTPAGFAGAGPFHLCLFAWALGGFSAVYAGIAHRAFDDITARVKERTSLALTRSMAYHPGVQHEVAEMRFALESIDAMNRSVTEDFAAGNITDDMMVRIVATKYGVVNQGWTVVDKCLDLTGGGGIFKRSRFEQLFRDARLGRVHPANSLLAHELVGKLSLGINPDEGPRWG
jgi:alkylation response protein AidB-like acyl-CoA dehydrogenase